MKDESKWVRPAVFGFYFVVVLEFLFMISPFALHFYSAYGPTLNLLHHSPATAWLTSFYLPHFSMTTSPLLDRLRPIGLGLAALGLLLFLIGAIQIYGSKLLRRGAVTGGLYRIVRHPQYLALTVLGLGVALVWPRFLVLISFVVMVFIYYALARWEERQCVEKFGDSYREYQRSTGMILPRLGIGRAGAGRPAGRSWSRQATVLVVALALVLSAAFTVRSYSLAQVSSHFDDDVAILSPARLGVGEIRQAYEVAISDPALATQLAEERKILVYVVPVDWFMPDLPLHTEEEIRRIGGGHRTPEPESRIYRVLFTRPRSHAGDARGSQIVTRAFGHEPMAIVRVDLDAGSVIGHDEVPDHVIWGDIPTPLF